MKLARARPHSRCDSGETCCAHRRRLDNFGTLDGNSDDVRLELHHPVVHAGAAVDSKSLERRSAASLHRSKNISRTECHRLERSTREVCASSASRKSDDCSPRIGLPVRRAKSRECGHEVDAIVRLEAFRERFRFWCARDYLKPVAQPLNRSARNKDRPFERVRVLTVCVTGDSGQNPLTRKRANLARIEKEKRSRAVSVLAFSCFDAGLAEKRSLLIAGHSADR